MTAIAAVTHRGKVYIGGDSAGVAGYGMTVRADAKVFTVGPCVVGFTTSFRMGQLLRYRFVPPPVPDSDLMAYMVGPFIDAVRATLKEGGWAGLKDGQESGGTFIVGLRGRIFTIASDYQVGEPQDDFDAVGCGDELVRGALYVMTGAPEKRIRRALDAAAHMSAGVRGPFVVVREPAG